MKILSDTGPIIGLAKIGKLHLLKTIAELVIIPPTVHKELFGKTGNESAQIDEALNDFIHIREVPPLEINIRNFIEELDEGEKQVIGLACSFKQDAVLLLDDRKARGIAEKLNIRTVGLVGLLLLAKDRGFVDNVEALLEALRKSGYWLSDELLSVAKRLAKE